MIVRLWHGRTSLSKADEYAEFMKERAAPDYASVDGLKKLYFLRRIQNDAAHFLLVTLWDSMESLNPLLKFVEILKKSVRPLLKVRQIKSLI